MIIGKFWNGSGLGNMLHRYVATRIRALDLGVDYTMFYIDDGAGKEQGFKGKFFIDQPKMVVAPEFIGMPQWHEKKTTDFNGLDIRGFDPEYFFVKDNTIIDGEFQDERYWMHREKEVNEWLKVEPLDMPDDLCVIGFRGGEFALYPELFLTQEYWQEAMLSMLAINPAMRFEVHTDDPEAAKKFFPNLKIIHNMSINWRSARYAKYAIIANSSFFILPRWLNKGVTIAPRYWARRNTKTWCLPQNYYNRFTYI